MIEQPTDQQADEDEDEASQPTEPQFGEDPEESSQRPSIRDAKDAYNNIRGTRRSGQTVARRGARATARSTRAAGRAAAQAARAAAQLATQAARLAAQAAVAFFSTPVGWVVAIILLIVIIIIVLVLIFYAYGYPSGRTTPQYPNPTSQADIALTAKFRGLIGDPIIQIDAAKQGAELLKKQLTASQQTLAAKTDQDSQKLNQKIDQAIKKLDEIIAETTKPSSDSVQIKKLIGEFFSIYDNLPGVARGIEIAQLAAYWAQDGPDLKLNSPSQLDYRRKSVCFNPTACSGFVATVMVRFDKDYNRGAVKSQYQYLISRPEKYLLIPNPQLNSLAPGDILIRPVPGASSTGHTGIYIGDGKIAHASIGFFVNEKGQVVDAARKSEGKLPRISKFSNPIKKDGQYYWRYTARLIQ